MGDPRSDAHGVGLSDGPRRVLPGAPAAAKALTALPWLVVAAAALVHTWPYRYRLVNLDAVSYLDVADAWRTLPWREAVNGYWSPLYSWILAGGMAIAGPPPEYEYVLVHGVNVVLLLVAFGAWTALLRELRGPRAAAESGALSDWQLAVLGTLLFLWAGLTQLVVWMESPDLIVAACTFAASACLLRLRRAGGAAAAAALGAVLGIGYLAKAAMFPMAAVYLAAAAAAARGARMRRTAVAGAVFLTIAMPWIVALSMVKGRVTTGDAGRLNYLWFVTRSENWPTHWPVHWPHWDGVEGRGAPVHPARRAHEDPIAYEFATPIAATYPMWYDASYWHEGVYPVFDVRDQLRRLRLSAADLYRLFTVNVYNRDIWNPQPAMVAVLALLWLGATPGVRWRVPWLVVIPAAATCGLYSLVYVEPRYLGGAIAVMWIAALAGVRVHDGGSRRFLRGAAVVIAIALATATAGALAYDGIDGWRRLLRGEQDEPNLPWHVASLVRQAGVAPGERVAVVGNAQAASRWARLGRVRIVGEVPAAEAWRLPSLPAERVRSLLDALGRAGVRAVLSEYAPPPDARERWVEVVGTPYWLYAYEVP